MRHDALACNGNGFVQTPNLDRLAARGVTFAHAFSPDPICVPGRAAITTGNYPHRCTGRTSNGGQIRDDQIKIADHFGRHDYWTLAVGKLHYVPYSPPGQPRLLHGFQHAELCEEGRMLHQFARHADQRGLEEYHDWLLDQGWGGYERAHGTGNNDVHAAPSPLPAEFHEESWVATRTIANLQAHLRERPDTPFFAWASFSKPHSPYDPPQPYDRLYDPRALPPPVGSLDLLHDRDPMLRTWPVAYGWEHLSPQGVQNSRAHYFGLVTFQDAQIGRMVRFLEEAGQLDNTILVYTADHGDLLGDFGCFFKCNMFHGSVSVPQVWAGPGIAPHAGAAQLVGLQDVLPTLADLTGCPLPQSVQGMSLAPALADPGAPGREYYVSQCMETPCQRYMIRTPEWKYVYHELGGLQELYDVPNDPAELRNLASAQPATVSELRGVLLDWCRAEGADGLLDGDDLRVSPEDAAQVTEFRAGNMGWRWY